MATELGQLDSGENVEVDGNALKVKTYGETSTGTILPIKVVDDGSGLGKLSVKVE